MSKYYGSNFGTMRNKLGDGVTRRWRNMRVVSVYNPYPSNPNTTPQQIQRTRFATMAQLAAAFAPASKLGFAAIAAGTKRFQRAVFMAKNFAYVTCESPGSAIVDYSSMSVASGRLCMPSVAAPTFTQPLQVDFAQSDTSSNPMANSTDDVYVFAYCPMHSAGLISAAQRRGDASIKINVPESWNGTRVHLWVFAVGHGEDVNHENVEGVISDSQYMGSGTIS